MRVIMDKNSPKSRKTSFTIEGDSNRESRLTLDFKETDGETWITMDGDRMSQKQSDRICAQVREGKLAIYPRFVVASEDDGEKVVIFGIKDEQRRKLRLNMVLKNAGMVELNFYERYNAVEDEREEGVTQNLRLICLNGRRFLSEII